MSYHFTRYTRLADQQNHRKKKGGHRPPMSHVTKNFQYGFIVVTNTPPIDVITTA